MAQGHGIPVPSPRAIEELKVNALRIQPAMCAARLWERSLSQQERERLGGDLETAYRQLGTAGMWATLRGVTRHRAVVEVAQELGFLRTKDYEWLLHEIGEILDAEEALSDAITSGDFVLVERPREAYWDGETIDIDWNQHNSLWEFLWELGRDGKAGQPVDRFTFGESAHRDVVTKRKSRLTNMSEFPVDLCDLIKVVGRGTQQLELAPERIRIFEASVGDTLREWRP